MTLNIAGYFEVTKVKMARIVLTVAPRLRVPIDNKKPSCCWMDRPFRDIQITLKGHSRSMVMRHFY